MWRRQHKPPAGSRKHTAAIFASLLLIFSASILILYKSKGIPISASGDPVLKRGGIPLEKDGVPKLKWDSFDSSVRFRPSTARRNGTDAIWQVPDSPKAALFIAHGCNGRAANFWDRSPVCPHCVGLPEERLVVLHALDRGFAVLTVSSLGRCWSFERELGSVKGIVEWWVRANGLERLPLVALGASSGGYFVSALATKINFTSIALMIAEGVFDDMDIPEAYPPTLFVHMPKDRARNNLIKLNMQALTKKGISVKEIRCMEFPLTPSFLSDRIPGLDRALSIHLFEILQRNDLVDEKGFMRKDGRATRWRKVLEGKDDMLEWADHIQEELNLAYAYHEMTSLQMGDILSWFEFHMKKHRRWIPSH